MKYGKIFWGAVLVLIGLLFILRNVGLVHFHWGSVWSLWPLLLVFWGVSLLPVNWPYKLLISFVILVLALIFVPRYTGCWTNWGPGWTWDWSEDDRDQTSWNNAEQLSEKMDSTLTKAVLDFEAAAGKFVLQDSTSDLIFFEKKGNIGNYSMTSEMQDESKVINLKMSDSHWKGRHHGNEGYIKLNTKPVWDFNMDIGAADLTLNLSAFKTSSVTIDGGASSIRLTIGSRQEEANVDINTGAASITIRIPESSGCEIVSNSFLTSHSFKGFKKTKDHTWVSENYDQSARKVHVSLDAAVSSLNVERY